MRFLVLSSDPALASPTSDGLARQRVYFSGHEARILVCTVGRGTSFNQEGVCVEHVGGATKFAVFLGILDGLVQSDNVDRVVVQAPDILGFIGYAYARLIGAEFLLQDHSGIAARPAFGFREQVWRPIAKWLCRSAVRIRTVSERGRRGLVDAWGIVPERISVIPIRQDLSPFLTITRNDTYPAGEVVLACVARLEREKGVDVLLRVFAASRIRERATLKVAGSGSQRDALERLSRELGIAERVCWLGACSTERVRALFQEATVYLQTSWFEGWGMALIEAAAAELPIVTTDVGCVGEVLTGDRGAFVASPGDVLRLRDLLDGVMDQGGWEQALWRRKQARECVQGGESAEESMARMRAWLLT